MKILYIADQYSSGGASDALLELIHLLREKYNVDPFVLTAYNDALSDRLDTLAIPHFCAGYRQFAEAEPTLFKWRVIHKLCFPYYWFRYEKANAEAVKRTKRLFSEEHFDLIHSNVNRNDIGGILSRKYKIPHIWHLRELPESHFKLHFFVLFPYKYMNAHADQFIAISYTVQNIWAKRGLDSKKITTVYDGVDLSKYHAARKHGRHTDTLKIVCIGEITKAKGQERIIRAVRLLDPDRYPFHVDFWGSGKEAYISRLKKIVHQLGLDDRISFKGFCSHVPDILPAYDIGINPSSGEGFGRTTVEYMASGLCTIAVREGVGSEIIEESKTGCLFSSTKELASILKKLYKNRKHMESVAKQGMIKAFSTYDMNSNLTKIYDLYQKIIGSNSHET